MTKRWKVVVTYVRLADLIFFVEELEDMQDIIENGPILDYIESITVTYNFKEEQ